MFDNGTAGLLDFDRTAIGPPAYDLASFYAHEVLSDAGGAADLVSTLHRSYDSHGHLPPTPELRWFEACAVLRQAMTKFRSLDPMWREEAKRMIQRAGELSSEART